MPTHNSLARIEHPSDNLKKEISLIQPKNYRYKRDSERERANRKRRPKTIPEIIQSNTF
jgi:hypothetical protein